MSIFTKGGMRGTEKSRNMSTKEMAESIAVTVRARTRALLLVRTRPAVAVLGSDIKNTPFLMVTPESNALQVLKSKEGVCAQ